MRLPWVCDSLGGISGEEQIEIVAVDCSCQANGGSNEEERVYSDAEMGL